MREESQSKEVPHKFFSLSPPQLFLLFPLLHSFSVSDSQIMVLTETSQVSGKDTHDLTTQGTRTNSTKLHYKS